MRLLWLFFLLACGLFGQSDRKVVLIVTADQTDWLHAAGGTVAAMTEAGADAHLVRVCNDDKDPWDLSPEETAARATSGLLAEPAPFVWQQGFGDSGVTYEINAYTKDANRMLERLAALRASIQDAFAAAGIELMTPRYVAARDGSASVVPPPLRTGRHFQIV